MFVQAAFSRLIRPAACAVMVAGSIAPMAAIAHAQGPAATHVPAFARYSNAGAHYALTYPSA